MIKLFNFILFVFVAIFIIACGNDPSLDVTGVDEDEYEVDNSKNTENDGINVNGNGNVINNNYYDASTKSITIKSDTLLLRDTTVIHDTIIKKEQITKSDTIISRDTVTLNNTVIVSKSDTIQITKTIHDTVKSVVTDTIQITKTIRDTIVKKDTIYLEPETPKQDEMIFHDDRNDKTYRLETVAGKVWFKDNLNYETPNSFCYDDNERNCDKYGRLYLWKPALTACPIGWHLPTKAEMQDYAKTYDYAVETAKAGIKNMNNKYLNLDSALYLRTDEDISSFYSCYLQASTSELICESYGTKQDAMSVRCVKD